MNSIFSIFLLYFKRDCRDKFALFWIVIFPLLLMSILTLIFGGMSTQNTFSFRVELINEAGINVNEGFSDLIVDVLSEIHQEENWLNLNVLSLENVESAFLNQRLKALESGEKHALILIPADFDEQISEEIFGQHFMRGEVFSPGQITIFYRQDMQSSQIAVNALTQIIMSINREINIQSGLVDKEDLINLTFNEVTISEKQDSPFRYEDYILPGIILMAFLTTGLTSVVEGLVSPRDKGILRRFFATPLKKSHFFSGLISYITVISIIQVLIIYFFGTVVFDVNIDLFKLNTILYLLFAIVVLMSLGLFIASAAPTANSANGIINTLIYPMMFLGGLYFPLSGAPAVVRFIVAINPVTYLINGLRDSLNVMTSPTSFTQNILIPSLWLVFCIVFSLLKFKSDPQGG